MMLGIQKPILSQNTVSFGVSIPLDLSRLTAYRLGRSTAT
ncbi:hypothetical protein BN903_74 [Halorubrum sp. AJ67]|nr:hypothetical protein BN903_74 [Halorubrum sp. AJ67]